MAIRRTRPTPSPPYFDSWIPDFLGVRMYRVWLLWSPRNFLRPALWSLLTTWAPDPQVVFMCGYEMGGWGIILVRGDGQTLNRIVEFRPDLHCSSKCTLQVLIYFHMSTNMPVVFVFFGGGHKELLPAIL